MRSNCFLPGLSVILVASILLTIGTFLPVSAERASDEIVPDAWTVEASSAMGWGKAENVLDGDVSTIWHTEYKAEGSTITSKAPLPHTLTVTFSAEEQIAGLRYYPRTTGGNSGKVQAFRVYGSKDGQSFALLGEGSFTYTPNLDDKTPKEYALPQKGDYRAIRFEITKAVSDYGTCAELAFLSEGRAPDPAPAATDTPSSASATKEAGERTLNIPPVTEDLQKTYSAVNLDPSELTPKATWQAVASSQMGWGTANNAIDGDKTTVWHSFYRAEGSTVTYRQPPPHEFTLYMNEPTTFSGLRTYVRQNNYTGYPREAEIYLSDDGETFYKIADKTFDNGRSASHTSPVESPNTVKFGANVTASAVRLVITDSWNELAILSELALLKPDEFWPETVSAKEYAERLDEFTFTYLDREGMSVRAVSSEQPYIGLNEANAYNLALLGSHVLENNTAIWHTQYKNDDGTTQGFHKKVMPAFLEIDLGGEKMFCGVAIKGRGSAFRSGHWKTFEVSVSDNGEAWTSLDVFSATMPEAVSFDDQLYFFYEDITARFVRFDITETLNDSLKITNAHASCQEINFLIKQSEVNAQKEAAKEHYELVVGAPQIAVQKGGGEPYIKTLDVSPFVTQGTTLIPLRGLFEEMGATVTWIGDEQKILVEKAGKTIVFRVEDTCVYADGLRYSAIVAPRIEKNARTLIPLRLVSEILGYTVTWNGEEQKIIIES